MAAHRIRQNMGDLEGNDIFAQDFIQQEMEAEAFQAMSNVQRFYDGMTILITGPTSLLGKVALEKILRVTDVKRIYVLIRPKLGETPRKRLDDIFEGLLYATIKIQRPALLRCVTPICGDCSLPDLGLSSEDRDKLVSEVDIILNFAGAGMGCASLRDATLVNVRGTMVLLQLAKEMRRLKVMVHLSTAFSNWPVMEVNAKIRKPSMTYKKLLDLVDILNDTNLSALQSSLLDDWPNPQMFTKHIAEDMIQSMATGLPVAIIRPGIVVSTAFEPIVGWVDNIDGPQAVAYWGYTGFLRVLHARRDCRLEIVPADLVANAVIALAWDIGTTKGDGPNMEQLSYNQALSLDHIPNDEIPTLNYVSSPTNPITWAIFINLCFSANIPSINQFSVPNLSLHEDYTIVRIYRLLFHLLPAALFDLTLYATGRRPVFLDAYRKIHRTTDTIAPYFLKQWRFSDSDTWVLWSKMSQKDRALFNFNISAVDWQEYLKLYVRGIRTYMAKDHMNSLTQARRRLFRLQVIYYGGRALILMLVFYVMWIILRSLYSY